MGSRHNRKRVRARPRYRHKRQAHSDDTSYAEQCILDNTNPWNPIYGPTSTHNSASSKLPSGRYMTDFEALYGRTKSTISSRASSIHHHDYRTERPNFSDQSKLYDLKMEEARMQMFGGETGDEIALCAPMLQVVMRLFDGNVDYEDE